MDSRPYWWEERPELAKSTSEEDKQIAIEIREFGMEIRSQTTENYLDMVNKEKADNEELKETNKKRAEANELARKKDALWNGLNKEKRLEICLPEIQKRTKELYFFNSVDRYLNNFEREVVAIQVAR